MYFQTCQRNGCSGTWIWTTVTKTGAFYGQQKTQRKHTMTNFTFEWTMPLSVKLTAIDVPHNRLTRGLQDVQTGHVKIIYTNSIYWDVCKRTHK